VIVLPGDLHGKITNKMVNNMNFFSTCKKCPHPDVNECSTDAVCRGAAIVAGESDPTPAHHKVPLLVQIGNAEEEGSFGNRLKEKCIEIKKRPGVLNCSVMHGFLHQDTDFCGVCPMVTTKNDPRLAWTNWRSGSGKESVCPMNDLDKTMSTVLAMLEKDGHCERKQPMKGGDVIDHTPIVIGEAVGNPGAGGGGGGVLLVKALMETKGLGKAAFIRIHNPETVKAAVAAGAGATIDVSLGGKFEEEAGPPIKTKACLKLISDGNETVRGGTALNGPFKLGPHVRSVMDVVNTENVIVMTGMCQGCDDTQGRPFKNAMSWLSKVGCTLQLR